MLAEVLSKTHGHRVDRVLRYEGTVAMWCKATDEEQWHQALVMVETLAERTWQRWYQATHKQCMRVLGPWNEYGYNPTPNLASKECVPGIGEQHS
mmetsp:Transcript_53020/g.67966  ORF Transcript_53020/g.67966 Transcript_53020/m.67966 type:complete len:95 (+) Transcript_53020:128-412(+)